ncbi:hypothetical protein LEM8419_00290 [Neolewinella maritima]|uniref:Heme oxygenase n=1 Tax=Neolewinella maritima TaxID=1383882 RepID=A0ABM9AWB3_9BACT|nr:biliverdin-producing heme oxygenase [Neolewinella maritima]CAH0998997.1 hypothetical protein LEM8419_00290 [Neolewinella maritima]
MSSPLLAALRAGTQQAHRTLEEMTLGASIMDATLSLAEYERILSWQRSVHEILEPGLVGFESGMYRYRPRFVSPTEHPTPHPSGILGVLYVVEGASLGGSLIYRKLRTNPRLSAAAPFAFYRDQAAWGLQQWRAYVGMLSERSFTEEEIQTSVKSAQETFAVFARTWKATEA